jgi:hypothetical protein
MLRPKRFHPETFVEPVEGPLAFGFGCLCGLGLFRTMDQT